MKEEYKYFLSQRYIQFKQSNYVDVLSFENGINFTEVPKQQ